MNAYFWSAYASPHNKNKEQFSYCFIEFLCDSRDQPRVYFVQNNLLSELKETPTVVRPQEILRLKLQSIYKKHCVIKLLLPYLILMQSKGLFRSRGETVDIWKVKETTV